MNLRYDKQNINSFGIKSTIAHYYYYDYLLPTGVCYVKENYINLLGIFFEIITGDIINEPIGIKIKIV